MNLASFTKAYRCYTAIQHYQFRSYNQRIDPNLNIVKSYQNHPVGYIAIRHRQRKTQEQVNAVFYTMSQNCQRNLRIMEI